MMATPGFFEALFLLQQCVLAMENLALFMVLIGCHQKYVKLLPFLLCLYSYVLLFPPHIYNGIGCALAVPQCQKLCT
jgi:hypothetical protein